MSIACLVCGAEAVEEKLDVGSHPVASFYLTQKDEPENNVRLALGQCTNCGTIQSTDLVPHSALVPPYDWIVAMEPEEHLDTVADQVEALLGDPEGKVVGALTYKDDTMVDRLVRKGFENTWRIKLDEDLGISDPSASNETVQKLVTKKRMAGLGSKLGQADFLIVRHILEHVEDVPEFVMGLSELVKPGGILMLEVPDCTSNLKLADYCMIWEEHSLYLTPETFAPLSSIGGFESIRQDVYERPFENSLVQLSRKTGEPGPVKISADAKKQVGALTSYADRFEPACKELRTKLEKVRDEQGPIALFGAGHLACAFVNFMGVADLIDFVADDTPQKQYKFLPGARLPILPSSELVDKKIALSLLCLSISNEEKVIARNQDFEKQGGVFRSIFRESSRSIFD
ncbi:MAG: class I SAM-dependent methyltransferase [Rhodobiaceae bacterium]|nr:class I SAM-dependent methyltransferase [Rhodobiaceae bacterium]